MTLRNATAQRLKRVRAIAQLEQLLAEVVLELRWPVRTTAVYRR